MPHTGKKKATKNWSDSFLQDFPSVTNQPYHSLPPYPTLRFYQEIPLGRGERIRASIVYVVRSHSHSFPPRNHLKWNFKMQSARSMGSGETLRFVPSQLGTHRPTPLLK